MKSKKKINDVESTVWKGGTGTSTVQKLLFNPAFAGKIVKSISHKYLIKFQNELRGNFTFNAFVFLHR